MPPMQHLVTLTAEDRTWLTDLLQRGTATALTQRRARVLLQTDRARESHRTDREVATACEVSPRTVARVREAWCARGRDSLTRRPRATPARPPLLDGAAEARVIATACSEPPPGYARWTLRLLAKRVVELEIAETISHETVRTTLKKTTSSPGASSGS